MRYLAYLIGVLLSGLCLMKLWSWFAVPVLHVEEIGFANALGLSLLMTLIMGKTNIPSSNDEDEQALEAVLCIVIPPIVLFLGWIIHFFQ